jgi:hypothetical protein
MPRPFKVPSADIEFPSDVYRESSGFLDIVAKIGPLIIAIIAVAFCFYIYKKVTEMTSVNNVTAFIEEQTNTNYQIQESYNLIVEQFNKLSNVVHESLVKNGTLETQISPSPSLINELVEMVPSSAPEVDQQIFTVQEPVEIQTDVDTESVLSINDSGKGKRGRKPKKEVNL